MRAFDAIVIGVGGMGGSALYHLTRRGLRVLGIEQFHIGHDRGSSHGDTRIIRKAYFEHPAYVPLLHRAYALWEDLQATAEEELIRCTGLLLVGRPEGQLIRGVRLAADEHNLHIECVPHGDLRKRFPGFVAGRGCEVLFEPGAGFLWVERCVHAHAAQAVGQGATIAVGQTVRGWSGDQHGVIVHTDDQEYTAGHLVICSGAWTQTLLEGQALPLEVRRKVVLWFDARDDTYDVDRGCPVFAYDIDGGFYYGFPMLGNQEIKLAEHSGGRGVVDPDALDRTLQADDEVRVRRFATQHLPRVAPDIKRHSVCMYTMTPDEHFVIDRHRDHRCVYYAAGFSGHGFKFAPIIGSVLADLVVSGRTSEPIGFLSASRPCIGC